MCALVGLGGHGEVDVRVALNGEGYTVNRVKWTYYVNTKPQKCLAYGPAVSKKCIPKLDSSRAISSLSSGLDVVVSQTIKSR